MFGVVPGTFYHKPAVELIIEGYMHEDPDTKWIVVRKIRIIGPDDEKVVDFKPCRVDDIEVAAKQGYYPI